MSTVDSIHTNTEAMIALQSLDSTQTALAAAQKQISTGYSVADATDNGAAYAIAQRVRASVSALTSANQQLGNVQGLLDVTNTSLNDISNQLNTLNGVMVKLADDNTQGSQRTQYQSQYNMIVSQITSYFKEAVYSGKSLIANFAGVSYGSTAVAQDDVGSTYGIAANGTSLLTSLNVASFTSTAADTFLSGTLAHQISSIATEMNYYGSVTNYVTNQISYNSDKIDALNSGLGSLIDANLAQESAQLQALQVQQQLGTEALGLANQAPSTLLSLFK